MIRPSIRLPWCGLCLASALLACVPAAASEQNTVWVPAQAPAPDPDPPDDLVLLHRVIEQISRDYIEPRTRHALMLAAVRGMVASLDRHSMLIEDKSPAAVERAPAHEFSGIGVELELRDGMPRILRTYHDGAAAAAGVVPGDTIVAVERRPTSGLTLDDVIAAIKGPAGSTVLLRLARTNSAGEMMEIPLRRHIVRFRTVDVEQTAQGVVVARIFEFLDSTAGELIDQLGAVTRAREPTGIVLDLRGNPGGMVEAAVHVASAFLRPNLMVFSTQARPGVSPHPRLSANLFWAGGKDPQTGADRTRLGTLLRTVPLVVLVDRRSASSSEIVASALQDHRRAPVVGCSPSLGKGSIQSIVPILPGYAVKLTTAHYLTPGGRLLEGAGVVPDLLVPTGRAGNTNETMCDQDPTIAMAAAILKLATLMTEGSGSATWHKPPAAQAETSFPGVP